MIAGVVQLGLVLLPSRHSIHHRGKVDVAVGHGGEESDEKRHLKHWLDLVRKLCDAALDSEVKQDTTEEGGEVEGRIVVVDVENTVHEEEW